MPQERSSAQTNEQEIQFKKRARRRLVGAVALVLLMVTVLPMVLDDRAAKSPQQEIAITIPSQDSSEFTSKIVPLSPENKSAVTPPTEAPKSDTQPEPGAEHNKPAESSIKQITELPVTSEMPSEKALAAGENANAEPHVNAASLEKKVVDPNTSVSSEFAVQIGVFSDAANVKQQQQKLQEQGYKSYTEKLNTAKGEKIRLRAGPFATRADAETALAKIKDTGLPGMIVSNK